MSALRTLSLALVLACPTLASAQVYKCVDGEGRITYTNDRSLGRSCQPLPQNQAVSTVPGPAQRATPAAPARAPAATSGGFPRVSQEDQRARDDTRRQVLHNELASEQAALEEAQKALAEQESIRLGDERNYQKMLDRLQPFKDKVELHQRNIDALQREIANLR
ncbi:MAG: DUF4124 domain-containing protein [Thauera phenolivorans]|uniref:DUF4124 domain-containing protein n=1 Tax=Thauera phenolivorans TaxID=1792543 RepID=A0A7X7LW45_9RHOO|nr:DUF4124 domain-containing protein [Thauera phenolivorans]NLF54262.1 DUF4124 domain-containing protein [Thauera phenolivorans]